MKESISNLGRNKMVDKPLICSKSQIEHPLCLVKDVQSGSGFFVQDFAKTERDPADGS
jgi:hypothetical protein